MYALSSIKLDLSILQIRVNTMSCGSHTYFCSDHVLNEIPKRRAQVKPRLPFAGHLGVLRMPGNPWDSKCSPRTALCIPGIPGACVHRLTVADALQRGVSLWVPHIPSETPVEMTVATAHGFRPVPGLSLACHIVVLC